MEGFQLDNIFNLDIPLTPKVRAKPVKRKWREIEAMNDRRSLLKELQELDACYDITLEDIKL
ncbi:hypothetical protein BS333_02340 [Vibrio azureus]|uniref:DUF3545 domain-containing protein n=1 Tax=Vibrio azureus NBRC 104587 TaxID=1219077 RepID=U3ARV0_9VIBR|nr:DUF3545 family protein [Vibrio azureus]AUI85319.1 hypothetical protein BS333_02340 [Vibrio azureus]GAD76480.1 hypothetical protein VAZ01S_045_00030 [Vibrio azureus NBRC 104587]